MPKKTEKNRNVRVVLTGGHAATTALSVVEEILRRHKDDWTVYWIGAKGAIEGKKVPTLESTILPSRGVVFHSIFTGRLQRKFTRYTIPSMAKIPAGFAHAYYLLSKIKPDVVLSFGGYASYPVVVMAWALKIPVVAHEQTTAVGRANKYSSRFAKKIALARETSLKYFPKSKSVVIGNPLMTQIWEVPFKERPDNPPTIFITGGSRGSQNLNNFIEPILESLLKKYIVIHQTGALDYEKFSGIKSSLQNPLKEKYEVYPFIDPMQIDGVYKRADIIVARAGANTVSEVIATKRPAIFIPIPWVNYDEQRQNAIFAQNFGLAKVLEQRTLKSSDLESAIDDSLKNWESIYRNVKNKKSPDQDAQKKLVDMLEECLK
jgi:UDP-N-acetylglucosamine--N-acetylmuramyl-(pentapeptide) pyrophosphoryl-undecaprenol N-acetylglucosamine transferase